MGREKERERERRVYLNMLSITDRIQPWLWKIKLCVFLIVGEIILT
jgi:hypothetical protein